jgi:L-2-hydroxyglutarate oxidase LhgO
VEEVDVLIVGAGVIGLAIAERLSRTGREIVVAERHESFGRETSSRNSEVIHAGLYYAEHLLKTKLCVRGNPLLYELCRAHGIAHRKTGKLVVATEEGELDSLQRILEQSRRNGVPGVHLLSAHEVQTLEPHVLAVAGLYSQETGIVDSHGLMRYLAQTAAARGTLLAYNTEVVGLVRDSGAWVVEIKDADGAFLQLRAGILVNSAGLQADGVAAMAGIDVDAEACRIYPCKGEYFSISSRHQGKLDHLVYPVPSPVHLGAHAVLGLDDRLKIGPNAFYVEQLEYSVDSSHQRELYENARKFLPFVEYDDLSPDMSGIRPKLYRLGESFRDFLIREESDRELPGLVDLIGMESPGLTACLAIAEMVEELL